MDGGTLKEILVGFRAGSFVEVLHRYRLAPSPSILLRKTLLCARASTPKQGWKRATGSVKSAAA